MGQRASDTRGLTFEDVVVPKEVRSFQCQFSQRQKGSIPTFLYLHNLCCLTFFKAWNLNIV